MRGKTGFGGLCAGAAEERVKVAFVPSTWKSIAEEELASGIFWMIMDTCLLCVRLAIRRDS